MAEVVSQPGGSSAMREDRGLRQSEDRTKPGFEPTEDEKIVVGQWLKRVDAAEGEDDTKAWRNDLERLRRYERGKQTVDDKKSSTNMIFATLAAQMPELYARNPTIAVTPTDAVPQAKMGVTKKFASTAEKVIRKMLVEEGKLKKRAKANIRSASVTSFGCLKVLYQKNYQGAPIAVKRIEDTQDNLARVEALIKQLKKTDDPSDLARRRDELAANLKAIASRNEVKIFKGFTIDRLKSEDFLVLDEGVSEFDDYVDARALGHKIWMPVRQARVRFGMEPIGATRYGQPRSDAAKGSGETPADDQFICAIEIWDKENGVVRTTAKGMNRWLVPEYAPPNVSQRWYPFYLLGFNITESGWRPLSDVEMLTALQDEYDRTGKNFADVREKAVPKRIIRKGGNLSEEDVKKIMESGNQDWVAVEGNPTVPISQDVMELKGLTIDPAAYDVSLIRNNMDLVSGRSDASRANLIKPKTATEAEIMNNAMQSRVGERRDTNEDLLSEMGEAALEIALRDLSVDEVKSLAGEDAQWPAQAESVEEIFKQVSVRVRAGSSGRPNTQQEKEQWGKLLPIIADTMKQVAELRAAGNTDMADATVELLRETLRRYDEHLDLDALIPPVEKDENGQPVQQAQMGQQLAQAGQQVQMLQQQVQELTDKLQQAQAGTEAKMAKVAADKEIADEKLKQAREDMQLQDMVRREQANADADFQTYKAKLDADTKIEVAKITAKTDGDAATQAAEYSASVDLVRELVGQIGEHMQNHGKAVGQAVDQMLSAHAGLADQVGKLAKEVSDNTNAERVPEYGPDGMPTRVTLRRPTPKPSRGALQ